MNAGTRCATKRAGKIQAANSKMGLQRAGSDTHRALVHEFCCYTSSSTSSSLVVEVTTAWTRTNRQQKEAFRAILSRVGATHCPTHTPSPPQSLNNAVISSSYACAQHERMATSLDRSEKFAQECAKRAHANTPRHHTPTTASYRLENHREVHLRRS